MTDNHKSADAIAYAETYADHFNDSPISRADVVNAIYWGMRFRAAAPQEPLTTSYVQVVPDKCDRIVWRNHYYHLPIENEWREAVLDECANVFDQGTGTPREVVKRVLAANVQIALDPQVSSEAAALVERGRAAAPPWPTTPEQIRDFIGSHFSARQDVNPAPEGAVSIYANQPDEGDVYTLTAHDLLSAFDWWADTAQPEQPEQQPDERLALREVYEAARAVLRFDGVDRQRQREAAGRLEDAIEQVKQIDGGQADELEPPAKYLTIVYRGVRPGDEARSLLDHPKMSAAAWSHVMRERDALLECAAAQEPADAARVIAWANQSPRRPATSAFTAGAERQAAYWIEWAEARAKREPGTQERQE